MNYRIGQFYRYPNDTKRFQLLESDGYVFKFKCGHWCTDNVFMDLINCSTGIQVFKDTQLKLQL